MDNLAQLNSAFLNYYWFIVNHSLLHMTIEVCQSAFWILQYVLSSIVL